MSGRASKFIDLLESQELLSPEVIDELRRQLRESSTRLKPELIAKLLVDNGHLTKFQATKLVSSLSPDSEEAAPPAKAANPTANQDSMDDELTFAEDAETAAESEEESDPVAQVFLEDEAPLVSEVEAVEVDSNRDEDGFRDEDNDQLIQAAEAIEPATSPTLDAIEESPPTIQRPVRTNVSKSNPWDSFRILGVGLLLALVLIAGFFLVNYFVRGSAEDRLNLANDAYEKRSYETAATLYQDFAETWPTNENASFARVRAGLANIRRDAEGADDPTLGLRTAMEVLPALADEPGLSDQRDDLAGILISLAGKFNERAAGRSTEQRQTLMDDMGQLLDVINDPKFVGQAQRNQQRPTLDKIDEDRSRILREIYRDQELERAIAEIDSKLEAKDTDAAYQIRSKLISDYPILEADQQLQQRVLEASKIQRTLVSKGTLSPSVSQSPPQPTVTNSIILGHKYGGLADGLDGQFVFAKVKGAVYGLDGETGDILWHKHVGVEDKMAPIRLASSGTSDALITRPALGQLSRVDGKTGDTKWFVDFGTAIHQPVVEGADLFVATRDGEVAALDLEGGQLLWNQKLPQPIAIGPGISFGKPNLYIPGDHSNLYVLSRADGTCREVFYTGHRAGSIQVPPILLLGQLFLFENINSSTARIRMLSADDDGLQLEPTQVPLPVDGNIVVSPQIDGRRLIVQSDLGQLLVLDVEPTAETEKVTLIASRAKNVLSPQLSWLVADSNKLWVADTRLTRFDLQVSMGRLNSNWSRQDGDRFTSQPVKLGDTIIHTRSLRGNRGVRVAAADPESGETFWEIDLGVPVTLLNRTSDNKVDAVNSAGMLYRMNGERLRSKADSNAGQGKRTMNFSQPVKIDQSTTAILNTSRSNLIALYSQDGPTLKVVSANFGGATPSSEPVAVDGNLALGLDNGQFILVDPGNGSLASSPYQPAIEAGQRVQWNTPAYLPQSNILIVASSLQKLVRLTRSGRNLRVLTEVDLEKPLKSAIIPLGSTVAAAMETLSGDALAVFDATTLAAISQLPLNGNLIAGPFATDFGCLLQTDKQILAVSESAEVVWTYDLENAKLVAPPLVADGKLVLATNTGEVLLVDSTSGKLEGQTSTGRPFSSAPLLLPAGLLIGSDEGAVLALPLPAQTENQSPQGGRG